jgi:hypothetical protein
MSNGSAQPQQMVISPSDLEHLASYTCARSSLHTIHLHSHEQRRR